MTDHKAAIERGERLNRLLDNEDFAVLLKEWDDRISTLSYARDNLDPTTRDSEVLLVRFAHRLGELKSLRDWIDDEIEIGGKHKFNRDRGDK